MRRFLWFGLGILAKVVSIGAALYSDWIWGKLAEGAELTLDILQDLWEFAQWAVDELVGGLTGHPRYQLHY